jgi:cytochrome P450
METGKISRSLNTIMLNSIGGRLLLPPFFRYLPLRGMRDVRRAVADMNAAVYEIIRQRRSGDKQASGDLLSLLMNALDEDGSRMTDEQLRDEVMTFLLAGHETTALALSWALYLLSQSAGAEEKLHEEVDRMLARRLPNIFDLPSLTFVDSILKETMRLYPPAWSVARTVIADFELEGYRIPAGANIVMSQWIMHRNPRFFSEPAEFDPNRWGSSTCQNLPRFAYFPFGGGPRQCIGASFATTEAVLILATIARRYQLVSVEKMPVLPVPGLTLRPKDPIRMRIEARP